MVEWKGIRTLTMDAKKMEKKIKDYSYEDERAALATDEKVCSLAIKMIGEAKGILFDIIELLYEMDKKENVSRRLQNIKDDIDIFSDEVKSRHSEWNELDDKWTVNLVKHDFQLIDGLEKLNRYLRMVYERVMDHKGLTSDSKPDEEKLWKYISIRLPEIESRTDELVRFFKEREGIFDIKPLSLEKTFEKVREGIDRQI